MRLHPRLGAGTSFAGTSRSSGLPHPGRPQVHDRRLARRRARGALHLWALRLSFPPTTGKRLRVTTDEPHFEQTQNNGCNWIGRGSGDGGGMGDGGVAGGGANNNGLLPASFPSSEPRCRALCHYLYDIVIS